MLQKALAKLRKLEAMTLDAAARSLDSDALEKILQAELADHDIEAFVRDRFAEARSSAKSLPKKCWRAIYQFAGPIGIDPGPLTLRELLLTCPPHRRGWPKAATAGNGPIRCACLR